MKKYLRTIWLFLIIVWRIDSSGGRMSIATAWNVATGIWLDKYHKGDEGFLQWLSEKEKL